MYAPRGKPCAAFLAMFARCPTPYLTAEMQNAGLAGVLQITLVAGAGFEPATRVMSSIFLVYLHRNR